MYPILITITDDAQFRAVKAALEALAPPPAVKTELTPQAVETVPTPINRKTLCDKALAVAKVCGAAAVRQLASEYGSDRLDELPYSCYPELYSRLTALAETQP